MKKIALFSLLFFTLLAFASPTTEVFSVENGKSIYLEIEKDDKTYTAVRFLKKEYPLYKHPVKDSAFYALIPVSYYAKVQKQKLCVKYIKDSKKGDFCVDFFVKKGDYKKEQLLVESSKVTLSKKNKKRASKEYKEAMKIYRTHTKKSYLKSGFILPMKSKITSEFGKARVYNGKLKGYHGGTDYRANIGTPVKASNDGVVVLAKDRFYAGGSVLIDHGHGIYSCYYHLSKFKCKKGDRIKKGDIIALSGKSGRVTGPHLHFGIRVDGVQVDPLHFVELMNENVFGL